MQSARVRVERAVAVARRVADGDHSIGVEARARLEATSGLSRAGIELGLTAHLEVRATDREIEALLGATSAAPRCHVVLAGNVCTAALRAVALAVATAPIAFVRPSRRDPVLAEILCRELAADPIFAALGTLALASDLDPMPGDELHVYGSDEAIAAIVANVPRGVRIRAHGSGVGVAVVGAAADPHRAASAIAADVVPFDQRGCLSPRIVLVEGDATRAAAIARSLDTALSALGERVPRGPLDAVVEGEIALYRAAVEAVGAYLSGAHHAVGIDPAPRALVLPPAARIVHVVPAEAASVADLLRPLARFISAIGSSSDPSDLALAVAEIAPRARASRLGAMQRPPFDGPVDRRTI